MEKVYRYLEANLPQAIALLERLCRQPSISAQGIGLEAMASLLEQEMKAMALETKLLPIPGGPPLVCGGLKGASPWTLLFYNHYDVQPPEPLELWRHPPFEPWREGRVFYARGAADNKGNIAARLFAIKAYQEAMGSLPVSVKFCIEGEEEIGSPHLAQAVPDHKQALAAQACIWESGGVNWRGQPLLILGVKGILYCELDGESAQRDVHSSLAPVVPNAAWRLVWALSSLKDREEKVLVPGFYDAVEPPSPEEREKVREMPSEEEELKKSLGLREFLKGARGFSFRVAELFEPTCTICGLEAGYTGPGSKTVLPSRAKAKVDFRLVPRQQPEDILAKVRRYLDGLGFSDIRITPLGQEAPARTPPGDPFVALVRDTARQAYGKEPVVIPTAAGTGPMAPFREVLGLPVVSIGVEHPESREHAPNENIKEEDFLLGMKHIAALIHRLGQGAPLGPAPGRTRRRRKPGPGT